jgi:hypothetical protein
MIAAQQPKPIVTRCTRLTLRIQSMACLLSGGLRRVRPALDPEIHPNNSPNIGSGSRRPE